MQPCNEGCTCHLRDVSKISALVRCLSLRCNARESCLETHPAFKWNLGALQCFESWACWENVLHLDLASKKEESELLVSQRRWQKSQAAESQWIGCCWGCKLRFSFQTKTWKGARTHADSRETHSRDTQLQQFLACSRMPSDFECSFFLFAKGSWIDLWLKVHKWCTNGWPDLVMLTEENEFRKSLHDFNVTTSDDTSSTPTWWYFRWKMPTGGKS